MLATGTIRSPALSIIIPAYNERNRLPPTIADALDYLKDQAYEWEVLVVDDGSRDGTAEWAVEDGNLRVLRSTTNHGKGAALVAGTLASRGQKLLFMDADGGTPLSALPALEAAMEKTDSSIVVGCRSETRARPWHRLLMGVVFAALTATCVSGIRDTQCGFKLLTAEAALATMPHLHVWRWAYDVELLYLAQQQGLSIASTSVPAEDMAGSKIRWYTPVQMLLDVARVSALYRFEVWALPRVDEATDMATERSTREVLQEYEELL